MVSTLEQGIAKVLMLRHGIARTQMTPEGGEDAKIYGARKRKRRKRGLRYCSLKQLQRAKMSRRRATILDDDISETARVLTYPTSASAMEEELLVFNDTDHGSLVSKFAQH